MWLRLLIITLLLSGCTTLTGEHAEVPDATVTHVTTRSYSGGSIPPFGPPGGILASTQQNFTAQLSVEGCASYAYRIDKFAYVSYFLHATTGALSLRVVNASDARAACSGGRAPDWRLAESRHLETGERANFANDLVGPVALAFVVSCDEPDAREAGTTPARGPCAYELSIDIDPAASSGDVVGSWDAK
mgnify:FL=1